MILASQLTSPLLILDDVEFRREEEDRPWYSIFGDGTLSFSEVMAWGHITFSDTETALEGRRKNQPSEKLQPDMFVMPCKDRIAARCHHVDLLR